MNKVYLLMCATGSWDDYSNVPVDAFTSKELAEKIANGLSDTIDYLKESGILKSKLKEADDLEQEYFGEDGDIERTQEEVESFYTEFNKKYGIYTFIGYYTPSYSVEEIDLIN